MNKSFIISIFGSAVISQYRITLLLGSLEGHWATTRAAKKERNTVGISGFSLFHYNTQLLLAANSRTEKSIEASRYWRHPTDLNFFEHMEFELGSTHSMFYTAALAGISVLCYNNKEDTKAILRVFLAWLGLSSPLTLHHKKQRPVL